jgi:hypothetical protein
LATEDREGRGSESRTPSTDDNVVRFPREWLGPLDELVPFGPSATEPAGELVDAASEFWGEGSGDVQAVVDVEPKIGAAAGGGAAPGRMLAGRRLALAGVVVAVVLAAVAGTVFGSGSSRAGRAVPSTDAASIDLGAAANRSVVMHHSAGSAPRQRVAVRARRMAQQRSRPKVTASPASSSPATNSYTASATSYTPAASSSSGSSGTSYVAESSQPTPNDHPAVSGGAASSTGSSQSGGAFTLGGP